MPVNIEQYGNFQSVTYEREVVKYYAIINDFKREISVKECGSTELDA